MFLIWEWNLDAGIVKNLGIDRLEEISFLAILCALFGMVSENVSLSRAGFT